MSKSRKRAKMKPLRQRFQHHLRNRVLSGLLVIVPLGITIFSVRFLYNITAGSLAKPIKMMFGERLHDYAVAGVSVMLFFAALYLVGMVATAMVGRRFISVAEAVIERIPLVKTIYGASKQVMESISLKDSGGFKTVVFIEFPRPGLLVLGFSTGTVRLGPDKELYYKVFIPTTPNPTSGYLEVVPADQVQIADLSVEEAVSIIMSGGITSPEYIQLSSAVVAKSNSEKKAAQPEMA